MIAVQGRRPVSSKIEEPSPADVQHRVLRAAALIEELSEHPWPARSLLSVIRTTRRPPFWSASFLGTYMELCPKALRKRFVALPTVT